MLAVSARSIAHPDVLWRVCSDVVRWPDHLTTFAAIVPLDAEAPLGIGSRFRVSQPGLAPAIYEITQWRPGQSFTWVGRAPGVRTTATHVVTPVDAGSRIELGLDWQGPLAGVVRLLLGRRARRMIQAEATTFARLAEKGSASKRG